MVSWLRTIIAPLCFDLPQGVATTADDRPDLACRGETARVRTFARPVEGLEEPRAPRTRLGANSLQNPRPGFCSACGCTLDSCLIREGPRWSKRGVEGGGGSARSGAPPSLGPASQNRQRAGESEGRREGKERAAAAHGWPVLHHLGGFSQSWPWRGGVLTLTLSLSLKAPSPSMLRIMLYLSGVFGKRHRDICGRRTRSPSSLGR